MVRAILAEAGPLILAFWQCVNGRTFQRTSVSVTAHRFGFSLQFYGLARCAAIALAMVMVTVGNSSSSSSQDNSTIPVPDTITFSPAVPILNNSPEPAAPSRESTFTIVFTAYNAQGVRINPTPTNPLMIAIYGIPPTDSGIPIISPSQQTINSGNSATFTYSGADFPNNLTLEAWIY